MVFIFRLARIEEVYVSLHGRLFESQQQSHLCRDAADRTNQKGVSDVTDKGIRVDRKLQDGST